MPRADVVARCAIRDSFRVQQVAGMFDLPVSDTATESFSAELPDLAKPWQIGLIVGPSGSGKSTLARHLFPRLTSRQLEWPRDRAVVDCFGELPIRRIVSLLTAVGFGSPPAWIKPWHVLSGGERFRCDLARTLADALAEEEVDAPPGLSDQRVALCDEFTSVVDRTVAQFGSAALSRALRSGQVPCRLVAVTCHYDVADWLEPDWVIDMATGQCARRRLRRPSLEVEIHRCRRHVWPLFARHHYLSGQLSAAARCYAACWRGTPVAFCATVSLRGYRDRWRISRIVTLPDFQGVGIGLRVAEAVAQLHRDEGKRLNLTASHPAVVAHCRKSADWRCVGVRKAGQRSGRADQQRAGGRLMVSFEYRPPTAPASKQGD